MYSFIRAMPIWSGVTYMCDARRIMFVAGAKWPKKCAMRWSSTVAKVLGEARRVELTSRLEGDWNELGWKSAVMGVAVSVTFSRQS